MLKTLVDQLQQPESQIRMEALCALAMVLETEALDTLAAMRETEQNTQVKEIIQWAENQIQVANEEGYSTKEAMRFAYRLDSTLQDQNEEKMREIEKEMRQAMLKGNVTGTDPAAAAATYFVTGAVSLALTHGAFGLFFRPEMRTASNPELAGLRSMAALLQRERAGRPRPIVPPRPTEANIRVWVKKLASPEMKNRLSAARQLEDFNNPTALGPLGWVYVHDEETEVRNRAQQTGLHIYHAALYWQDQPAF